MAWKRTEDGISAILKEELQNLGVVADLTPSWTTPIGLRKPDLLCRNAGVYPVEAKFTERDLIVAIAKVQNDYLKYHKVLGIKGGFAILYPEQLSQPMPPEAFKDLAYKLRFKLVAMFPAEDPRPFKVYESQLPEIAKILYEHILAPPKFVEPSIDYIINSLRESALYLLNGLKHLTSTELEGFFGGEDVFKNILQYEEGKYPVEEWKLAAAYLLVNQLLFYHALSRLRPEFPEIDSDKIGKPSDLNQYFEKVLDVNYKMVFSYDVVSLIPPKFLQEVRTIINVISGLGAQKVGGDLLGTIFHDLIPFETRKNVAAFYTNVLAAELLAFLSVDKEDSKVADFAVGSGGLLVAAYRRKRDLLKEPLTQETHKRFVQEELLGIDVMPFAANVAACHLALQSPQYFTDKVSVAIWDSTDLRPGRSIPSVAELKTVLTGQSFLDTYVAPKKETKGVVGLSRKKPDKVNLETYDVVIMNPPFTRQERIPEEYKTVLLGRFKEYKEYLHGRMGYHGYFVLLADRFLKENGRIALVLPATILRLESFQGIRSLLAQKYHVEHIVTTWHRSAFSESVLFREILLVAKKNNSYKNAKTTITVLKRLPRTLSESRTTAGLIRQIQKDYEDNDVKVKTYSYKILRSNTENWFKYMAVSDLGLIDLWNRIATQCGSMLTSFREYLDNVNGRIYEGARARTNLIHAPIGALFVHRDTTRIEKISSGDRWVLKRLDDRVVIAEDVVTHRTLSIPRENLTFGLRRLSNIREVDVTDSLDMIVIGVFPKIDEFFTGMSISLILKEIPSWMSYVKEKESRLMIARRFDLSARGTNLLSWYSYNLASGASVFWNIADLDDEDSKIMALWFNSTFCILQTLLERSETRGAWIEISKYMLETFPVPDIRKLQKRNRKMLLSVFDNIRKVEFPSVLDQLNTNHSSRRLIDTTWLKVLGYDKDVDNLLDRLYDSLANEIELLRKLMAEGRASGENGEESE